MTASTADLRLLTACGQCRAQYDASSLAAGSRFHCDCGSIVEVPEAAAHDATVVRCSACGASRDGHGMACAFCGASFTLHERDLHTLCPGCFTRISDLAKFCHACGLAIAPCGKAGENTDRGCPACEGTPALHRRVLANDTAILECGKCAGLWLQAETFRVLEQRAQTQAATASSTNAPPVPGRLETSFTYRKCPDCQKVMNRRNYGLKSGVILDICDQHGVWFDHQELERVLDWIRRGGLARTALRQAEELRAQRSRARLTPPTADGLSIEGRGSIGFERARSSPLNEAIDWLFDAIVS